MFGTFFYIFVLLSLPILLTNHIWLTEIAKTALSYLCLQAVLHIHAKNVLKCAMQNGEIQYKCNFQKI